MVDIDWFLTQAEDQIIAVDNAFERNAVLVEPLLRLCLFAAWAVWRNILLMVKVGMVTMTDEQDQRFTYLKLKFVQYSSYLPKETSDLSI